MSPDKGPADPTPLRGLLAASASRFGLDDALAAGTLFKRWGEMVGPDVASHAQPTSLRQGILRIRADSPVWAHEIGYLAEEIKTRANAALGRAAVTEVRVWNEPGGSSSDGARTASAASGASNQQRRRPPAEQDPFSALERARAAWLDRRRKQGPGGP